MRHLAARSPRQLLPQRLLQIAAHRAAQAAVFQQQRAFGDALQQMMVEPDLAELVDEDQNVGQLRRAQQTLQQRGFAAAEKAGDDVDRRKVAVACHRACVEPAPSASLAK